MKKTNKKDRWAYRLWKKIERLLDEGYGYFDIASELNVDIDKVISVTEHYNCALQGFSNPFLFWHSLLFLQKTDRGYCFVTYYIFIKFIGGY